MFPFLIKHEERQQNRDENRQVTVSVAPKSVVERICKKPKLPPRFVQQQVNQATISTQTSDDESSQREELLKLLHAYENVENSLDSLPITNRIEVYMNSKYF